MILGNDYTKYRCDNCKAEVYGREAYRGAGSVPKGWMAWGISSNNGFRDDAGIHLCPDCKDEKLFRKLSEHRGVSLL